MTLNESETLRLLQTIIDNLPGGVSLIDKNLRFVAWNTQFKQLLDFPDELFESGMPELERVIRYNASRGEYGPGDPEEQVKPMLEKARTMSPFVLERMRPDGTMLEIRGRPLPDGGLVSTYTDITQRKCADEELRRTASYFQTVLNHLPFGVAVTDNDNRIVYWNDRNAALYGFPEGFIQLGMPLASVARALAERGYYGVDNIEKQLARRMEFVGKFQAYEAESPRAGGGVLLLRGMPVLIDGMMIGFVHLAEDISERKAYQAALERLATTDHLTGLLNRRAFFDAAEKEIRRARRFRQPVSLLMLDIDVFKSINDTHGHPLGDEVLRQVGAELRLALRDEDITGRIGGEEFAVILVQMALADAVAIAERVRQALAAISIDAGRTRFGFTASIGIASVEDNADTIDTLLAIADQGLYEAKRRGRNRVHCIQAGSTGEAAPVARQ